MTRMGWKELGEAVLARRVEMGYRGRGDFAKVAELSVKTIGEIERADRQSYDPSTLAHLERVLGWERGTVTRLLHDEPAELPMVMTEYGPLTRATEWVMYALDSGRLPMTAEQRERLAMQIELAVLPYIEMARQDWARQQVEWEKRESEPFPEAPPSLRLILGGADPRVERERREGAGG